MLGPTPLVPSEAWQAAQAANAAGGAAFAVEASVLQVMASAA
jgi:hypothetical protein